MATLFEQSLSHHSRCFACGSLVYAVEKKMTTNHVYHNRCFRCRICKRNLTGYSLNEEGDDIYCGNCYRRKQRGDCNSFDFYRAAAEKAQYVHYRHHPDHPHSLSNPRSSSYRDVTRHPSLTLRQLERQFLSHPSSNSDHQDERSIESSRTSAAKSPPTTINTSFSAPVHVNQRRYDSTKDEPAPSVLSFFSPLATVRTETTITPRVSQKSHELITHDQTSKAMTLPSGSASGGIEFRLNKSSIDLTNGISTRQDRKNIIIPDLNPNNEQKESKYRFPDTHIAAIRRRSSSAKPLKTALLHVD